MAKCALWILLLALATPVWAQPAAPAPSAEDLAARANKAYQAGKHLEAVELYREAYALSKVTAILYNIALIYDRQLDDEELAMQFYRQYLAAPDADPKAASRATTRMQELKAEQAKAEAEKRKREEERRKADEERRKEEAARAAQPPPEQVGGKVSTEDGSGMRLAGWVTAGAGVAAIGTGVYFGLAAQADADDFASSTGLDQKKTLRADGEGKALVADVLYGVGGAALITGVLLLLLAPEGDGPTVGAGPTAEGGASLWIGGRL